MQENAKRRLAQTTPQKQSAPMSKRSAADARRYSQTAPKSPQSKQPA